MSEARRIAVGTEAELWTFTQRNVPLWDILDFFPPDAVGPRGPADEPRPYPVRAIVVETDLGFEFETDIQLGTWQLRPRSPKQPGLMRWCRERGLRVGDAIVFERSGERRYRVWLERDGAPAPPPEPAPPPAAG